MKKISLLFACLLSISMLFGQLGVTNLLCENLVNPIGIDVTQPRFNWQLSSAKRNVLQTAYEIKVLDEGKQVWSSGKVNSSASVFVNYSGSPLASGKKYSWQVRTWDNYNNESPWSEAASFQMALLTSADWKAKWISPDFTEDTTLRPSPLFRKEFKTAKKIRSATAYITAHGLYEGYLNGHRIGEYVLTPGWTSYKTRLQYQTYDVTGLLNSGNNAIAMTLGSGWYRGHLAWDGNKDTWGKHVALLFQLDITYADGTKESIVSDKSWKSATGEIVYAEIYNGEVIDSRKQKDGWRMPGYNDSQWAGVAVQEAGLSNLVATENEPVRKHETFKALKVLTTPHGERVIDFGQNLVGWVTVKLNGHAGDTVTLSHAEVLDKYGNFYTDNLRAARAQTKYILSGKGEETFEPHFTFFGFRYIKIEGIQGEIDPTKFEAVTLYSGMKPTGQFTSSDPLINQLQHNIQWGQRGNFLDVPTDCPQRDERLGWTGDAQAFSRTAAFNFGVHNFFSKWLKDVAADQQPSGSVPFVIPNVLGPGAGGATGWADVATIIPWNMYLAYGDTKVLENQYKSMQAWVGYMENASKNYLWNTGFHFGDWLFYRPFDDNDGRSAVTDKYLIAQCFFCNSVQIMINAARVLHKSDDEARYTALLAKLKEAFIREYTTPNGRLVSGTQTAYVLALNFDMLPEGQRASAADRLVENIKSYGNHLTTGFLGTPYLCHVLSRFGHSDVAFSLLMQQTYPSWLYPVKMGATTIWERWDGIKPDGTFETPSMNSFNHYAYGAIGDWMYRVIAGLDTYTDRPGYKHIRIQPHIGGGLTSASATLNTNYGNLTSAWNVDAEKTSFDITIPPNCTADVLLPAASADEINEGGQSVSSVSQIHIGEVSNGYVRLELGSGNYHFAVKKR